MSKPRTQGELDAINAIHEVLERFTGKLGRIDTLAIHFQNGVERKIEMHGPDVGGYRSITDYGTVHQYFDAYPERIGKDYEEKK